MASLGGIRAGLERTSFHGGGSDLHLGRWGTIYTIKTCQCTLLSLAGKFPSLVLMFLELELRGEWLALQF